MDYSKPVYFRPSETDAEMLELIAKQRPAFADSATDLLRIALEAYWFEHGPNSKRSKSARIEALEAHLGAIEEQMRQISTELASHGVLLRDVRSELNAVIAKVVL